MFYIVCKFLFLAKLTIYYLTKDSLYILSFHTLMFTIVEYQQNRFDLLFL